MIHGNRRWNLAEVADPAALAEMLTQQTWTLCSGWCLAGHPDYLVLNDAFSEDGAAEYAILKREGGVCRQIESITFSWCSPALAERYLKEIVAGDYDGEFLGWIDPALDPDDHTCNLCR